MKLACFERLRSRFEKAVHGPKYELVESDTAHSLENLNQKNTLFRIMALRDIPEAGVTKGELGGYVESERNLAHHGSAWVADEGKVYGRSLLCGTARVEGKSELKDTFLYDVTLTGKQGFIDGWGSIYGPLQVFSLGKNIDKYGNQKEENTRLEADLMSSSGFILKKLPARGLDR